MSWEGIKLKVRIYELEIMDYKLLKISHSHQPGILKSLFPKSSQEDFSYETGTFSLRWIRINAKKL